MVGPPSQDRPYIIDRDGRALAEKLGYLHFETSAKSGVMVRDAFYLLACTVMNAKLEADPANAGVAPDDLAAAVAATVKARLATVVDDIDFGVRSPMFEFTIITSALDEDAAYAKLQRAAGYVY